MPHNSDHDHAISLDQKNGDHKWADCIKLEIDQQHQCDTCKDVGTGQAPEGCKRIRVHFAFDVKHNGRHKARLVANGHLTDVPLSSVYSGVVSLRGIRLVLFLAKLSGLESWGKDIGNAYLEARTKEKVFIEAGPEFGPLEGHNLIIAKASHGLRTSGLRWHERLADYLRDMGFEPCKMELDIWLHPYGEDYYDHIAVCVDDLLIASNHPKQIIDALTNKHSFKLKGTEPISYHIGRDFGRDDDGTLHFAPQKHVEIMIGCYCNMLGTKPKLTYSSPLEKATILN